RRLTCRLILDRAKVVELERRAQTVRIRDNDGSRQERDGKASLSIRGWRGRCRGSRLSGTRTSPSHGVKLGLLRTHTWRSQAMPLKRGAIRKFGFLFEMLVRGLIRATPESAFGIRSVRLRSVAAC